MADGSANRAEIVESVRVGLGPEPVAIDTTNASTLADTFVKRYEYRPDLFAHEVCGIDLDDWQQSVAFDVAAGVRLIAIRSCHNVGKSTILAIIALWFLLTRYRCKVVMTAPSAGQLFDALYAETKSSLKRCPQEIQDAFEVKADRIELKAAPEDVFLTVRTSSKDRPEALQGIHSDNVLLIADEGSGIHDEVYKASSGSTAGVNCTFVMAGNPTRLLGRFARAFNDRDYKHLYKRYHVSKKKDESIPDGTLHFVSNRITDEYENDIIKEHGLDSDEYAIRVLGDFPGGDRDAFISASLVVAAMQRDIQVPPRARKIWMVDPARYGDDRTARSERVGPVTTKVVSKPKLNTMQVVGWIKSDWDALAPHERPEQILVDVIGIGAGVVDRLEELELPVYAVNVSESPSNPSHKCMRLRDEIYKRLKDELVAGTTKLPEDDELLKDLTCFGYSYSSDGRLKIESKEELRKRGEKSPDKGDSVAMGSLIDDIAAVAADSKGTKGWGKPIVRNVNATV